LQFNRHFARELKITSDVFSLRNQAAHVQGMTAGFRERFGPGPTRVQERIGFLPRSVMTTIRARRIVARLLKLAYRAEPVELRRRVRPSRIPSLWFDVTVLTILVISGVLNLV